MRPRLILPLVILALLMAVTGCQLALPGQGKATDIAQASENPIVGDGIAVTSLDAPAAAPQPVAQGQVDPVGSTETKAEPDPRAAAKADTPAAAAPVPPATLKTAAHLACEKRGGRWSVAGGGSAAFCQIPTKDAGKSCTKSNDCSGYCLEKSRTCAPVTPMLGCHDILNETGRMLTQCIN
ncbi:MAG: hypothetical protein ACK4MS_11945 [Paracoccaceae bacterium]